MNQYTINKKSFIGILFIIWLTSCSIGKSVSSTRTEVMLPTELTTLTNTFSASVSQITPTPVITSTEPLTATNISTSIGYELKDWHEATEVITPDNMDRVEKIGELDITTNVYQVKFSPDGMKLGVGMESQSFVLDAMTFTKLLEYDQGGYLAFGYDGHTIVVGSDIYNMETNTLVAKDVFSSYSYQGYFVSMAISPNGDYMAMSTSEDKLIAPITKNIQSGEFTRPDAVLGVISISPDSRELAVSYQFEHGMELWDVYRKLPIRILKLQNIGTGGKSFFESGVNNMYFTGYGKWNGQDSSFIQEWDYKTGKPKGIQLLSGLAMDTDINFVSNMIIYNTLLKAVYLEPLHECNSRKLEDITGDPQYNAVAYRPDGKLIAFTKDSHIIELWGIPTSSTNSPTPSMATASISSSKCPTIPMDPDYSAPKYPWWSVH